MRRAIAEETDRENSPRSELDLEPDRSSHLLDNHGFEGMSLVLTVLIKEVMNLERILALESVAQEPFEGRWDMLTALDPGPT